MIDNGKPYELFLLTTRLASREREPEKWPNAEARRAVELQGAVERAYQELGWVVDAREPPEAFGAERERLISGRGPRSAAGRVRRRCLLRQALAGRAHG